MKIYHESAVKHVTGKAIYVSDMEAGRNMLFAQVVYSEHPHALIKKIDVSAALKSEGVKAVILAADIPGKNQMGPVFHDEPCLADKETSAIGQAIVLIAADSEQNSIKAAKKVKILYKVLPAILDIKSAIKFNNRIAPPRTIQRGNADMAIRSAACILHGEVYTGAQEHWYLETQSALCVPGEDNRIKVFASSQNPAETQAIVAEVLGIQANDVSCEVTRMGGGFGGKETQANHVAAWAALLAVKTQQPVMIQLCRDDDQKITGKRHPFYSSYTIGFSRSGKIDGYKVELNADAGHAADLSMAILERATLHADNAYYIPNVHIKATAWRTNHFSNTAFRGFGGPQGIAVIEHAIDAIARYLKKDAAEIRSLNFYDNKNKFVTPYGQNIKDVRLQNIFGELMAKAEYKKRKKEVDKFNSQNFTSKKGIALTPVKFGISFTTAFLNQAGALVNIYKDGTMQVNHGGTEMGQGLHTKILRIASSEFAISPEKIRINPTNTDFVPNTSATAASSGSDLNGMAVKNAIDKLKARLLPLAVVMLSCRYKECKINLARIIFKSGRVYDRKYPLNFITIEELVQQAYLNQLSLSATGFYKTPDIFFNRDKGCGKPFHYFSYGMAISECQVDILTGESKLLRVDIVHDVGSSINKEIDIGQISGAFIQGLGWVTTEEIKWDADGRLLTYSPDTYKIPTASDIPDVFNISLLKNVPNINTIHNSKAVGEPPFMLAFSVWMAIRYAVSAVAEHKFNPDLNIPCTNENILLAIEKLKRKK